jgi:tryptophan synthase alpha chain
MIPVTPSRRIDARFRTLGATGRKALVCYVTAGHPDRTSAVSLVRALEDAGADIIELGVPFSDPMADGPVIQLSSQQAIAGGMTLDGVLELAQEAALTIPVVLFSYLNPILAGGSDVLVRARAAGVDGILVTDLPVGADPVREGWLADGPLDNIRLVAPTTPADRMRDIAQHGSGFVYLISRLGVTGERASLATDLPVTVQRLKQATDLPVCVGFGISTAEQARDAAQLADGVVVGSALVRAAGESIAHASALVRTLRTAIDHA